MALTAIGAGAINTMVGGGTFIMLPILAVLGVDPKVANATNRLAVCFQAVAASATLHRQGVLSPQTAILPLAIAVIGGVCGALLNGVLSDEAFRQWVGWLLILGLPLLFLKRPDPLRAVQKPKTPAVIGLFVLGVYGGFLGAGVGVLILLVLPPLLRADLVRTVAIKVLIVLAFSFSSGVVYIAQGMVDWKLLVPLIGGYMIGGIIGARLTVRVGDRWMRLIVALVAAGLAITMLVRSGG
ncbi:MAG: sulfite exporter TauE/SafE family protein [Planctomycetota bacterium]